MVTYSILWVLDYNGVIGENPVDSGLSDTWSWLKSLEVWGLEYLPGRLLALGLYLFRNLKVHDQFGMSDSKYRQTFYFVVWPLIYNAVQVVGTPINFLMPFFLVLFYTD